MKQFFIILMIITGLNVAAAQIFEIEDIPTAELMLEQAPFDIRVPAENWWLLNTPLANKDSSVSAAKLVTPIEGEVILTVTAKGGIGVKSVDLTSEVTLFEVPGFGNVSTKIRINQVVRNDMSFEMTRPSGESREFKVSPREGFLTKEGFFILPWLVRVEAEAFPGMSFDVFIQTFGFMGKDVFPGVNYFDFGKIFAVEGNNVLANALSPMVNGIVNINGGTTNGPIDDDTTIEIPIDPLPLPYTQKMLENIPSLDQGPWKNYLETSFTQDLAEALNLGYSDESLMFK